MIELLIELIIGKIEDFELLGWSFIDRWLKAEV